VSQPGEELLRWLRAEAQDESFASTMTETPAATSPASAASEGAVLGFGGLLPVTSTVNASTIASDSSQPKMNAAPFLTPPFDARTRMNAVSGIGSS
jgi:hypothetical protein